VGPRASLDGCGKSRPPLGFDPLTARPVASRYTDWAILAYDLFLVQVTKVIINLSNTVLTKEYNPIEILCTDLYTRHVNINTKLWKYYRFSHLFKIVPSCVMVRQLLQCIAWDKGTTIHLAQFTLFVAQCLNILKTEQRSLFERLYFSFRICKRWTIDTVQGLNRAQCDAASSERYRTVMWHLISLILFVNGKQLFLGRKACKLPTYSRNICFREFTVASCTHDVRINCILKHDMSHLSLYRYLVQVACESTPCYTVVCIKTFLCPNSGTKFFVQTYLLTYLLTPWCRVPLEKLTGLQLVKKFPAFHGTRRFITALTSVGHLSKQRY